MTPEEYREAYEHGATIADIAMFTGKAESTVRRHLLLHGTTLRPRNPPPLSMDGECYSGHLLSEHGSVWSNGRVVCTKCDSARKNFLYQNDPVFREAMKQRSRDHKRKKKSEKVNL